MFPSFIGILDIQSWWEVPSIAYFCSLFRTAFNLLDFDIEELEEALLTDGTEESASSLLTELIVRLLNGCLGNNDISAFNYQMYLRRLFRRKCQETGRYNPFNTDIDFQFLPLRTKVEILYALCDFRLDAEDVFDLFKNLEAESLRVEPLGYDNNDSAYWYFYGTRLYREDTIKKQKGKNKKKKGKESKKRGWFYGDDWLDDEDTERVWQVVCFTEDDWTHLTEKFSRATSKVEKELYRSLSQNFLPEIPRLFQEKERLQRKRLLELAPRRTSSRVLQKIKQKEEEGKQSAQDSKDEEESKETPDLARENRAKRRNLLRSKSDSSDSDSSESEKDKMPQKVSKRSKSHDKRSKNSSATHKGEPPPEPPVKTGRKTNNSLACATGQILIPENDEPVNSTRKKLKTSQIFTQTEEDIQTDMYKVLEQLTAHDDAWPFMDPVEEEYAPNYYAVIRRPMDLRKMEERLDSGYYTDFAMFKADFKLIVNNCRLYNGQDNEYTMMVDSLQAAFDRLTEKYMHRLSSSDEEIAVEYQLPTPSRKHKLKSSESPSRNKRKKRKSHSDSGDPKSSSSDQPLEEVKLKTTEDDVNDTPDAEAKKSKQNKEKKKRKGHHRHGKHSKNHKKDSHKSEHSEDKEPKSKHSKKQKHGKNKNKEGKKSKQKKKKSKHHETEPVEVLKRSESQDSLESSNRSRSASPLPSIHTPTPSPSEADHQEPSDQLNDPDFVKDKYDKIKERRRHAAKDAWESLFDYSQKTVDKQKQNLHIPEKEKNQKLRETIEKLKAKSEKYKDSSLFNSLFSSNSNSDKNVSNKDRDDLDFSDEDRNDSHKIKGGNKRGQKKNTAKNESASEALEQAVKDISKWLDDAPKGSVHSSPSDSPAHTISTEEHDNSRHDDEFGQIEKTTTLRKDLSRKRPSSREPKLIRRREIQRTIERLQPGKSKGNLLTNLASKSAEKVEEATPLGPSKTREISKNEESSPKLSLGSVLHTVEFSLGKDHNFSKTEDNKLDDNNPSQSPKSEKDNNTEEVIQKHKAEDVSVQTNKKDVEVETEPSPTPKPSQEKATPNLSAWFKAFGTPKNTTSTVTAPKKKPEETECDEKVTIDNTNNDIKVSSPKNTTKYDSPIDPETPNADGGDSPLPNVSATPRQRRTSTGSSVSERSSFSQDLDSPRHQMSHNSPLLRSPASPRTDDFQKITYPIINGTVRAGFYQDTTSIKSSPEKSCSPREAPQSPYSPYSQHVYASNSGLGSSTPNYFLDHNKSPLPTYTQNPPPYYDTSKAPVVSKPARIHDDYTALGPDSYQQNTYSGPFSPSHSPYPATQPSKYTQPQLSPQPSGSNSTLVNSTQPLSDHKTSLFPVKKRMYNEPELPTLSLKTATETKDSSPPMKNEYQKKTSTALPSVSVDKIAAVLSEKSELANQNSLREKNVVDFGERHAVENKDTTTFINNEHSLDNKKNMVNPDLNQPIGMIKKDNIDMVNMGYNMNPDEKKNIVEPIEIDYAVNKDVSKPAVNVQAKTYDVDKIAMNLGLNQQFQKSLSKSNAPPLTPTNIIPAHSHSEMNINHNIAHAHHNQYDGISGSQPVSNFSLNDIELANKKLYACNNTSSTTTAIDYGNWKLTNQIRKQDVLPSDYSTNYSTSNTDKLKNNISTTSPTSTNYNKNVQHQQYHNYSMSRTALQRTQELHQNLPSELRIPNPRGLLKNDHMNITSTMTESDMIAKSDSTGKTQKSDKTMQNQPIVSSMAYKTPYNTHSSLPLDSLRNLPNIPQMLERYTNDERYLSSFAATNPSLYHDKTFQMAQMFNKSMPSDSQPVSTSVSIYSQPSIAMSKDSSIYKTPTTNPSAQADSKSRTKRKRTSETKPGQIASQSYHTPCATDVLSSVKTSMVPGSAFNFGTTPSMALGGSLYGDGTGFSIEEFRNSTNQLMAANYMAAVAHQQRNNVEASAEKLVKPAHQNSTHNSGSFPFIGHGQVRSGYGFVGADSSAPLYQQYFQRHQEELLRQSGVSQIMGLYPPGYPAALGVRQPYDAINRPSWL
ncbi:uncharacterized protein LOC134678073 isoform X1 [Cydia fagiglandana]|uniref:uncharacterized protein LOC134678073 isoform X1 n=1 Tax=Cydia fagiglandana TaxID=1458189 RepID=UPI002FEE0D6B